MDAKGIGKLRVIIDQIGRERDAIARAKVRRAAKRVPSIIEGSTPMFARSSTFGSHPYDSLGKLSFGSHPQEVHGGF